MISNTTSSNNNTIANNKTTNANIAQIDQADPPAFALSLPHPAAILLVLLVSMITIITISNNNEYYCWYQCYY